MRLLQEFGVCDSHSHVYGPFDRFPLSEDRTFTPSESPINDLETAWSELGIDRAVLVQGSAHGEDHRALLEAISRDPEHRRGIALLPTNVTDARLAELHVAGVRGVRFNWARHLLGKDPVSESTRLSNAAGLLERISCLGWHAEIHIDAVDLESIRYLEVPSGMAIVIDHMARPDVTSNEYSLHLESLMDLLHYEYIWFKLSGADRATSRSGEFKHALPLMRSLLNQASDRCVWGLDWPHVSLPKRSDDGELAELLLTATDDESVLQKLLIHNPEKLYDFASRPQELSAYESPRAV